MKSYVIFLKRCFGRSLKGGWRYHAWLAALFVMMLFGLNAYSGSSSTAWAPPG